MKHWDESCPIVIVPTTFYQTPTEKFEKIKISLIIWANHMLRSAVTLMQKNAKRIYEEKTLVDINSEIVPVNEIFRLQNVDELMRAEKKYLPQKEAVKAIVLAASQGTSFGALTEDKPKTMIEFKGKPILQRIVDALNNNNIKQITVAVGYKAESVNLPNLNYVINDEYEKTNIVYSLYKAKAEIDGPVIISFGDVLYEDHIIAELLSTLPLQEIGEDIPHDEAHGEWIGVMKLTSRGSKIVSEMIDKLSMEDPKKLKIIDINDFIQYINDKVNKVYVYYFHGHWHDIDSIEDISGEGNES